MLLTLMVLLCSAFSYSQESRVTVFDDTHCRALYAQRPLRSAVLNSIRCFDSANEPSVTTLEAQLYALSYAVTHFTLSSDRDSQNVWINSGLAVAERLNNIAEWRGAASYWTASFRTFQAALADGLPIASGEEPQGLMLPPINMMQALPTIRQGMAETSRLNPGYHGYGAARNLGIMHLSQPEFFFPGSARLALTQLRRAYDGALYFSMNAIFYAKAEKKAGTTARAIQALEHFISTAGANIDAYGADRRPETQEDLAQARTLLRSYRTTGSH